ncbi:SAG family member [Eimeria brunetti]|uniref:SAG family member n=1 Tax=Eimeria brunetti TaxID=51314 RepID=U6L8S6_9EIME|nr:SAG family member [Eimeria brunetti]
MASFYKTITAVCLVAFSGLQPVARGEPTYKLTAEDVTEGKHIFFLHDHFLCASAWRVPSQASTYDARLSVNLARNGKLPVHINEVTKDEKLVTSLTEIVVGEEGQTANEATCQALWQTKKNVFHHVFQSQEKPDYSQLLQASLEKGLKIFENKEYPKTGEGWTEIWSDEDFANLAHLLSSNSTKVGCVVGKCTKVEAGARGSGKREAELQADSAVLLCDLQPAASNGQAPFDEDYFTGLIARTAKLTDMTADDLKATNDATTAAAVPTIMFAGLVAMLTAFSA